MSNKLTKSEKNFLLENGFDPNSQKLGIEIENYIAKERQITKEDIFCYIYAVLHDSKYRSDYEINLKQDFPRIPFYDDFWHWSDLGKKLMNLHLGQEDRLGGKVINLKTENQQLEPKLKANRLENKIALDNQTVIADIPSCVWEYKLGNRSAIEWVLEQYKPPKKQTEFDMYNWEQTKPELIHLLQKIIYISQHTVNKL